MFLSVADMDAFARILHYYPISLSRNCNYVWYVIFQSFIYADETLFIYNSIRCSIKCRIFNSVDVPDVCPAFSLLII